MQTSAFDAQYIAANDTPWFPYGQSGCEVQLIQTDPTTGQWDFCAARGLSPVDVTRPRTISRDRVAVS